LTGGLIINAVELILCISLLSFVRPTYAVQTFAFYIHVGERVSSNNCAAMVDVFPRGGLIWAKCLFCQDASSEKLVCPAKSNWVGVGYVTLSVD